MVLENDFSKKIFVILNKDDFSYDILPLVKSFFPLSEVKLMIDEKNKEEYENTIYINYFESVEGSDRYEIKIIFSEKEEVSDRIQIDSSNRKETKNELKKLIYRELKKLSGRELPWGTLSGIRPAKIASSLLEEGLGTDEVKKIMKSTYLISDEKFELAARVAQNEQKMLGNIDKTWIFSEKNTFPKAYSLYIAIPFCPTICSYCTFSSMPVSFSEVLVESFIKTLKYEMKVMGEFLKDKILTTVYVGGGTPTSITAEQLDEVITSLKENFNFSNVKEFTVEAGRPDSITKEKLKVIKKHGADRISVNPQTMNEKTLEIIERKHSADQVRKAFKMARECGFENINMDFIIGLPEEGYSEVKKSMEEAVKLKPDSITIHSLAFKRAAKINIEKDSFAGYSFKNDEEIMNLTNEYAKKLGMEPYYLYRQKNISGNMENIGYARPGKESLYNVLIMEDRQWIMALGAGGISKALFSAGKVKRAPNVKDVQIYIDRIEEMIDRKKKLW